MLWRPVVAQMDTLHNVKTLWTLDDLATAHDILDAQEAAERQAIERAQEARRR